MVLGHGMKKSHKQKLDDLNKRLNKQSLELQLNPNKIRTFNERMKMVGYKPQPSSKKQPPPPLRKPYKGPSMEMLQLPVQEKSRKRKQKSKKGHYLPPPRLKPGAVCGVYGLIDPATSDVIYIGGGLNVHKRYKEHQYDLLKRVHKCYNLQEWYDKRGLLPQFEVLESCPPHNLHDLETSWIQVGLDAGWPLLNILPFSTCRRDKEYEELRQQVLDARKRLKYGPSSDTKP